LSEGRPVGDAGRKLKYRLGDRLREMLERDPR
jgi:hypothetical protein